MVDKFKQIAAIIEKEKGKVSLFATLKMDNFTDKWTVILSAAWISTENRKEIFDYLRKLIIDKFSLEERAAIARIGIFPLDTNIIRSLLEYRSGTVINENVQINGNLVYEGNIIISDSITKR